MRVKRITRKAARIEMLPLIDIVFLLLVFFIYAMLSMAVHNGLQLDLPESSQADRSPESPLSLFIRDSDNGLEIAVNNTTVTLDEVPAYLSGAMSNIDTEKVLVFAEEKVTYQQLYQVLDQLKKAGIHDISLEANRE
jgi:biopolymer transport protein ExbD